MKRQLEDHLRKPNTSPNAESSMSCLSCATPPANDWFSEKPTVHSRSNQQRAAYHQSRNWCATEQLLPATHATHPLDSPLTVPVNNATQATGWSFSIWSWSQWLGPWGEPRQRASSLVTDHSDINKAFSSIQVPLNGYFLSLRRFSVEPGDGCPPNHINISLFWCSNQTSARHRHHNHMHNCTELLLRYWLTD